TVQIGQLDVVLHRGQLGPDRLDLGTPVDTPAAVDVPVDGHQYLRADLLPAVHHRAGTELGRARGEDRAEAGGGEQEDDRLRDVGQVRGHPVARPDAGPLQGRPDPA